MKKITLRATSQSKHMSSLIAKDQSHEQMDKVLNEEW